MEKKETTTDLLTYIAQLLWVISAQLHALTGSGEYPIPDVQAVADIPPSWPDPGAILSRLKGGAP